jgi:hypothetical protein
LNKTKQKENGEKFIELSDLRDALKCLNVYVPAYDLVSLESELKKNSINQLSLEEFTKV